MKDAYSTWDEARREMFADFPVGDVRHLLRDFMERRYRREAREYTRGVPNELLGWTALEYGSADALEWHDMGWRDFGVLLHRVSVASDKRPLDILEAELTINGVLDFEDKFAEFEGFVLNPQNDNCDNARRLRDFMRGMSGDVQLLHDRATILMTLAGVRGGSGIAFKKRGDQLVFGGVYECGKTIGQLLAEVDGAMEISEKIESARKRGRPCNPNGRTNYLPTEAKRLAAIAIVETLRSGKADTQTRAVAYCRTHPCDEYAGANFAAFDDDGSALHRWAKFNGANVTAFKSAQAVEWEEIKKSLK